MLRMIFVVVLFLWYACSGLCQLKISGKVVDSRNKALPAVAVLLHHLPDSALEKGTVTDSTGLFSVTNITPGIYILSVSAMGYQPVFLKENIQQDIELQTVELAARPSELRAVVVTAKKPFIEQKLDRLILNTAGSYTTTSGTVLDLLNKSPGVEIDRSRNLISLNGKEGVVIMINGKICRVPIEGLIQMMSNMNVDNIEKIELITTPPPKYESAGNAGIINIQLKENLNVGASGSITPYFGYGEKDKEGISINYTLRRKSFAFNGNVSGTRDYSHEIFVNTRSIFRNDDTLNSRNLSHRSPVSTNITGRVGIDYFMNKKLTIGGFVLGYTDQWNMVAKGTGYNISSNQPVSFFDITTHEVNTWKHITGNANASFHFDSSNEMTISTDYLSYLQRNPTKYNNVFTNNFSQITDLYSVNASKQTPVRIHVSNLDFQHSANNLTFESGIQFVSSHIRNDINVESDETGVPLKNTQFSNNSDLLEKVGAVYISADYYFSKNSRLKTGVRLEYTHLTLDTAEHHNLSDTSYLDVFPTLYFSQKISNLTTFILSYSRRISRPNFTDIAPFIVFLDPNTFYYGNLSLVPSKTNDCKMDVQTGKYLFSFDYNDEENAIVRYQPGLLNDSNQVFTSLNLKSRRTLSLSAILPLTIHNWSTANISLLAVHRSLTTLENRKSSGNYIRLNGTQTFLMNKLLSLELSGFYQTSRITGISTLSHYGNLNFGAQLKLNNKSKMTVTFTNILGYKYSLYTEKELKLNYDISTFYRFEPHIIKLSYSYTFGNNKIRSGRIAPSSAEQIKERIN